MAPKIKIDPPSGMYAASDSQKVQWAVEVCVPIARDSLPLWMFPNTWKDNPDDPTGRRVPVHRTVAEIADRAASQALMIAFQQCFAPWLREIFNERSHIGDAALKRIRVAIGRQDMDLVKGRFQALKDFPPAARVTANEQKKKWQGGE